MRPFQIHDITGVGQGSTAIIRLPLGVNIHAVVLDYLRGASGAAKRATQANVGADFDEMRVLVNGDVIQRLRNTEVVNVGQAWYGQTFQNGSPIINFAAPWAARPEFGRALALGTAQGVDSATIEIDIDGGAGTGVSLKAFALIDPGQLSDGQLAGPGVLRRFRRYTPPAAVVGRNEWAQLPLRGRLLSLHLVGAAVFSDIKVLATGAAAASVTVWEGPDDLITAMADYYTQSRKEPQTGIEHIDFEPGNDLFGGGLRLDNLAELRLELTGSTAGAYSVIAETLE